MNCQKRDYWKLSLNWDMQEHWLARNLKNTFHYPI